MNQIGIEETTEVILLAPIADAARSSLSSRFDCKRKTVHELLLALLQRDQGRQLAARSATPGRW